mmetsp:Transcript_112487/g.281781  ORF Transcript_112487/g.281781 Transcript_112487/m.281781 type:complete len:345 (-) Transcript_112487:41-1075(-)
MMMMPPQVSLAVLLVVGIASLAPLVTSEASGCADSDGDDAACVAATEEQVLLQQGAAAAVAARVRAGAHVYAPPVTGAGARPLSARDLARARQVVPGTAFLAAHAGESNKLLNKHMTRLVGGKVRPCEDFALEELEQLQREVHARSHPELQGIYTTNRHPEKDGAWRDPRGSGHGAVLLEPALARLSTVHARAIRAEKACYDIAMHFTHSLADADKKEFLAAAAAVPLLPVRPSHETNAFLQSTAHAISSGTAAGSALDLDNGESVFKTWCEACHLAGNNIIEPRKRLYKEDMEKFLPGGLNVEAIKQQVINGRRAMPSFDGRLSSEDLNDVSEYVLHMADKWD